MLDFENDSRRSATAGALSLTLHMSAFLAVWLVFIFAGPSFAPRLNLPSRPISLTSPRTFLRVPAVLSGGGGGDRSVTPATRGAAPPLSRTKTFIVPLAVATPAARLAVQPTLLDAEAPKIEAEQYGDPLTHALGTSLGTGWRGIGSGGPNGLGPGKGNGLYEGEGGHSGGRVYQPGQGVSTPALVYKLEPEYSDQARQAKFQGTVLLRIIVDENGIPREIRVTRPLGLGLDEKAIEAVRHWRFRPARKDGKPVAVEATVEVNFRLL